MKHHAAVIVVLSLSVLGVAGDALIKQASQDAKGIYTLCFLGGFLVYASTALGWFFVMPHLKLASLGAIYSVATVLLLSIAGFLLFGEKPSGGEFLGMLLAGLSIVLLTRYST